MPGRLRNKVAIVTGASSGIGRAIALLYAKEGASVVCADLRPEARMDLAGEGDVTTVDAIGRDGGKALFCPCDVEDVENWEVLVNWCVSLFGRLDILVNNAGIAIEATRPAKVHLTDEKTWDKTMSVNAKSVFLGCKYGVKQMLAQEPHESGDRGWIINISSIYGMVGGANNPSYSASKGAVLNLTRNIAVDYSEDLIHCNAICPGHIETAIFAETTQNMISASELKKLYPFRGPGKPIDIARMAVVLASEDASWMTGSCIAVDGGYTAR